MRSRTAWPAALLGLIAACAGGQGTTKAPAPQASAAAAEPRAAPGPEKSPGPIDPELDVFGIDADPTAFEWDVEDYDSDPSPLLDGVPRVSRAVSRSIGRYLETRRAQLSAAVPDGSKLFVLTRLGETTQVHEVARPLAMRRQITFGREPVVQAALLTGSLLAYRSDVGGRENHQIFQVDLQKHKIALLTDGKSRHGAFRWSNKGGLAFASNARNGADADVYVWARGARAAERLTEQEGTWEPLSWSSDGARLLVREYRARDACRVHVVDVATKAIQSVSPGDRGETTIGGWFTKNRDYVHVISNRDSEFMGLYEVALQSGAWREIVSGEQWDVEEGALSTSGRLLAYVVNEDGYSRLFVMELGSGNRRRLKVPDGVLSGIRFTAQDRKLAFTLTTPAQPADAFTFELDTGRLERWTSSEVGGLDEGAFISPQVVRLKGRDGLEFSSLFYEPAGEGPFPVLLWMHGGPEEQSRPAFDPIIQYFASSRGVAVIAPNVRGSSGYGKRFLTLDDTVKRHQAVEDVGAVLDFVRQRPNLDASRVGIHGASYGGFMVLASLVAYPDRLVAGSDLVGMSSLVTFLESTGNYRRNLRRAEYGDERDPATRAYLEKISPLGSVDRIKSALLVAHGENDPRVPLSEAEQLVAAVRERQHEAWLFVGRGEGHGFYKRRTRDAFYRTLAEFFERYLIAGKRPPEPDLVEPAEPVEPASDVPGEAPPKGEGTPEP